MTILGIEAAAKVAGAAVLRDDTLLAEEYTDGTLTHSQTLMPMIHRVLHQAGKTMDEIDLITLTSGPGSFTGLRIGAATAKGLALGKAYVDENGHMAGGIPILPLGTLESLCAGAIFAGIENCLLVGTMDARRSQVYAAAYDSELHPVIAPEAMPPAQLADQLCAIGKDCLFMGDAALLYRDFFAEALGERYHLAPEEIRNLRAGTSCYLAAKKLGEAAEKGEEAPTVHGWNLAIDYLRKPQAEREREARLRGEQQA